MFTTKEGLTVITKREMTLIGWLVIFVFLLGFILGLGSMYAYHHRKTEPDAKTTVSFPERTA